VHVVLNDICIVVWAVYDDDDDDDNNNNNNNNNSNKADVFETGKL
jgi:hypothetical protein